jgi:hypothetical protein
VAAVTVDTATAGAEEAAGVSFGASPHPANPIARGIAISSRFII